MNTPPSFDPTSKYAVGDVDRDSKDEVAVDFGTAGIWLYDQGNWIQLSPENPEGLFALGAHLYSSILADFGSLGLWRWGTGTWYRLSGANVESMAYGTELYQGTTPGTVLFGDFGVLGAWFKESWWDEYWLQLSGSDPDYIIAAHFGPVTPLYIDCGALGMWRCVPYEYQVYWYQMSSLNPDYITCGWKWVAADFGTLGLWQYSDPGGPTNPGVWTNLTGADADFVIPAETNGDNLDEIVADFGSMGLWLWNNGTWAQLSGVNPEYLVAADTNGDGKKEILSDFGALGLWMWDQGNWTILSGSNPD